MNVFRLTISIAAIAVAAYAQNGGSITSVDCATNSPQRCPYTSDATASNTGIACRCVAQCTCAANVRAGYRVYWALAAGTGYVGQGTVSGGAASRTEVEADGSLILFCGTAGTQSGSGFDRLSCDGVPSGNNFNVSCDASSSGQGGQ